MERPLLPPFPMGWYALVLSRDLPPGAVRPLTFAGREIVLFRTESGQATAFDAYCPHLGAHLGYGGRVIGEALRCPFHGFRFDTGGHCVHIPYGTKTPPLASTEPLHLHETHGIVLAWHGAAGSRPSFRVPDLDTEGRSPIQLRQWRLRGHPQETTENSVDLGHFTEIHGYTSVEVIRDAATDGPYLTATYAMTRRAPIPGPPIRTQFDVHVYGLGYSHVDIDVERYGMRGRLFVLSTPVDGDEIDLRIGVSIHRETARARAGRLLALVPRPLFNRVLAYATYRGIVADVEQDFEIWRHKRYVQPPVLAQGDGPVGRYRLWARQFYSEAEAALV